MIEIYKVQLIKIIVTNRYIWRYMDEPGERWWYIGISPFEKISEDVTPLEEAIVRLLNIAPTTPELEEYFKQKGF